MPSIVLDTVLAVPVDDSDPLVASGPGDATAAGELERADADVEAAKQSRFISAFHPDDIPGASESTASLEVAALMQQLEDLDAAAQRSVAAEVESAVEGGACLTDEAGRARVLELCKAIRFLPLRNKYFDGVRFSYIAPTPQCERLSERVIGHDPFRH